MRDTDIGAVILHPCVRPDLTAQLLINSAGVSLLRELEWKGAAEEELLRAESPYRFRRSPNRHRYAHIETPPDPLLFWRDSNRTRMRGAEIQVVSNDGSDGIALCPELSVECLRCSNVSGLVDKVLFLIES